MSDTKHTHFERRGNMVYGEDTGPGTAPFIAECAEVPQAEFIVRACNSHEALCAALADLVAELDSIGFEDKDTPVQGSDAVDTICRHIDGLRAALKLARGES